MATPPTHEELVQRALRWLRGYHRCSVAFAEFPMYGEQPDAIGWQRGFSVLVEVKVSRSDFWADKSKPHRGVAGLGMGSRRWYLTPPGLLKAEEIPQDWGLAEAHGRAVRIVVPAVHRSLIDLRHETHLLALAVQRHQDGVTWFRETGRFMATTHPDPPMNRRRP